MSQSKKRAQSLLRDEVEHLYWPSYRHASDTLSSCASVSGGTRHSPCKKWGTR